MPYLDPLADLIGYSPPSLKRFSESPPLVRISIGAPSWPVSWFAESMPHTVTKSKTGGMKVSFPGGKKPLYGKAAEAFIKAQQGVGKPKAAAKPKGKKKAKPEGMTQEQLRAMMGLDKPGPADGKKMPGDAAGGIKHPEMRHELSGKTTLTPPVDKQVPKEVKSKPEEKPNETSQDQSQESARQPDLGKSDAASNGGNAGAIPPPEERIVTARSHITPAADPGLVPEGIRQHLDTHQIAGVAASIRSLDAHGGFLLSDGTGVGKTRQQLAVAKTYADRGGKVLIVTKSEVIKPDWKKGTVTGSFDADSKTMGVKIHLTRGEKPIGIGEVHLTTYDNLAKLKDKIDGNTTIIFDESHSLKNWGSARAKNGYEMSKLAGRVMYATATPADKPLHIAHLFRAKVFGDRKWEETYQTLGMIKQTIRVPTAKGYIEKWEVSPHVGAMECVRRISGLFDKMTEEGLMLKREISMKGVDVSFEKIKLPQEAHDMMDKIEAEIEKKGYTNPGLVKAAILMHQRRQQETFKVPHVVAGVQKELAEGRSVVVFASRVNASDVTGETMSGQVDPDGNPIKEKIGSEGTMKLLKEEFAKQGIHDVVELHGGAAKTPLQKKKAMEQFQSGKGRVIIATLESGGTGINLDDTVGDKPRTLFMMTAPFSAVENVQAAGRVWRLKTKSAPRIKYIFGDTDVDHWNASLISSKMKTLNAAVQGEIAALDVPNLDVSEEEAANLKGSKADEIGPYKWPRSLTGRALPQQSTTSGATAPKTPEPSKPASSGAMVKVTGDTYPHRDKIKAAGGKWNADRKLWEIPEDKIDALKGLRGISFGSPLLVSGNTFAHKDKIKAAGGRWDGDRKGWVIPPEAKARLDGLGGLNFKAFSESAPRLRIVVGPSWMSFAEWRAVPLTRKSKHGYTVKAVDEKGNVKHGKAALAVLGKKGKSAVVNEPPAVAKTPPKEIAPSDSMNPKARKAIESLPIAEGKPVPAHVLEDYPDLGKNSASWHQSLPEAERERLFAAMRRLEDKAEFHRNQAKKLTGPAGTLAVGSADIDEHLNAYALDSFLLGLRKGDNPDDALAKAKADAKEFIANWNAKGSKGRVVISHRSELHRWEGAADAMLEDAWRSVLSAVKPGTSPERADVESQVRSLSSGTIAKLIGSSQYGDIEQAHADLMSHVQANPGKYETWQYAWEGAKREQAEMPKDRPSFYKAAFEKHNKSLMTGRGDEDPAPRHYNAVLRAVSDVLRANGRVATSGDLSNRWHQPLASYGPNQSLSDIVRGMEQTARGKLDGNADPYEVRHLNDAAPSGYGWDKGEWERQYRSAEKSAHVVKDHARYIELMADDLESLYKGSGTESGVPRLMKEKATNLRKRAELKEHQFLKGYQDSVEREKQAEERRQKADKFETAIATSHESKSTPASLVSILKKKASGQFRRNYIKIAQDTGWATEGRFLVKMTPKDLAKVKEVPTPDGRGPDVEALLRTLKATTPATIKAGRERLGEKGKIKQWGKSALKDYKEFLVEGDDGRQAVLDGDFLDIVMARHPKAIPFLPPKDKPNSPIVFKDGGEVVGVIVPIQATGDGDAISKPGTHKTFSERCLFDAPLRITIFAEPLWRQQAQRGTGWTLTKSAKGKPKATKPGAKPVYGKEALELTGANEPGQFQRAVNHVIRIGSKVAEAHGAVKDKIGEHVDKLPGPLRVAVKSTYHAMNAHSTAAYHAVESVAQEIGLSKDQAGYVASGAGAVDYGLSMVATAGLTKKIPFASLALLAVATLVNPLATYRAAKKGVQALLEKIRSKGNNSAEAEKT